MEMIGWRSVIYRLIMKSRHFGHSGVRVVFRASRVERVFISVGCC